jgi:hypothetical protein
MAIGRAAKPMAIGMAIPAAPVDHVGDPGMLSSGPPGGGGSGGLLFGLDGAIGLYAH